MSRCWHSVSARERAHDRHVRFATEPMPTSIRRQTIRIPVTPPRTLSPGVVRCRRRFVSGFPGGFRDETYVDRERDYKWAAHEQWQEMLSPDSYRHHLDRGEFAEIAASAVRIESRTNLLYSFEKMALRDAIRSPKGARLFAEGLYGFLYGDGWRDRRSMTEADCDASTGVLQRHVPSNARISAVRCDRSATAAASGPYVPNSMIDTAATGQPNR